MSGIDVDVFIMMQRLAFCRIGAREYVTRREDILMIFLDHRLFIGSLLGVLGWICQR